MAKGPGICGDAILTGKCQRFHGQSQCRFAHDLSLFCRLCSFSFATQAQINNHFKSRAHKALARTCVPHCNLCNVVITGEWADHCDSQAHETAVERWSAGTRGRAWIQPPFPWYRATGPVERDHHRCDICHLDVPVERWEHHIAHAAHRIKRTLTIPPPRLRHLFATGNNGANGGVFNKGGKKASGGGKKVPTVTVSHWDGMNFGVVDCAVRGKAIYTRCLTLTVKSDDIRFLGVKMSSTLENGHNTSAFGTAKVPLGILRKNTTPRLDVTFTAQDQSGAFSDRIELEFLDTKGGHQFVICRALRGEVTGNKADFEALQPVIEYRPPPPPPPVQPQPVQAAPQPLPKEVVAKTSGAPPADPHQVQWATRLPWFDVPANLKLLLQSGSRKGLVGAVRSGFLPPKGKELDIGTYAKFWQTLLWVEEEQQRVDLLKYSMEEVTLSKEGFLYYLPVPGLIEKRPSVVVGDLIKIKLSNRRGAPIHDGYVHKVRDQGVMMDMGRDFPWIGPKVTYDVEFTLNRLPLRRQHQAVVKGGAGGERTRRILFPEWKDIKPALPGESGDWSPLNRRMMENGPQKAAVTRILELPPGSPPFIVFGPFGTGKTTTLVEAIEQLLDAYHPGDLRILACAPSNAAADAIAIRLKHLGKSRLLRMNAPTREWDTVLATPDLADYSLWVEGEEGKRCRLPEKAELMKYDVVVSTCVSGGVSSALGVPPGHFDWVFVDEAGQASETEVLIPMLTCMDQDTNLVLCGDPKQLGPIIHSPISRGLGHGKSFLDRLMSLEMYDDQGTKGQNGLTVVKLLHNFRNHKDILRFPNEHLYRGELIHCAQDDLTCRLERWSVLPNPNFPIIFHGIVGQDKREGFSPSYFNPHEVLEVRNYVDDLLKSRKMGIKASDIGIIAPYAAQCSKLRNLMRGVMYKDIKIGSVEEFQGQERAVIIMSTTRSATTNVTYDIRHSLGFLASPRRLNVAITRAQACLIFVGNPNTLSLDPLWRALINYIYNNGGYVGRGVKLNWNTREEVNFDDDGFYARVRTEAEISRMDALERRLRGTVMASQGAEEEERYSDEEDDVVLVATGERIGWRDSI